MQVNMESILGFLKFPRKQHKTSIGKRAADWRLLLQPKREFHKPSRDKYDNSRMLNYLRGGVQIPSSIFNIYENESDLKNENEYKANNDSQTENSTSQSNHDSTVDESAEFELPTQQPGGGGNSSGINLLTVLAKEEEDYETCFYPKNDRITDLDARVAVSKKIQPLVRPRYLGNEVGQRISDTWDNISKRLFFSLDKIKSKVVDTLEGLLYLATDAPPTTETVTIMPTTTTTKMPEITTTKPTAELYTTTTEFHYYSE